jgi:hypothetical protein
MFRIICFKLISSLGVNGVDLIDALQFAFQIGIALFQPGCGMT